MEVAARVYSDKLSGDVRKGLVRRFRKQHGAAFGMDGMVRITRSGRLFSSPIHSDTPHIPSLVH